MIQIYRDSFRFFLTSFPFLLLVGGGLELALWYFQPKSAGASTGIALILLAYLFHRHFLFGETLKFRQSEPADTAPPHKVGFFVIASLALTFVPLAAALPLAAILPKDFFMLGFMALYLVALSMFGTLLPATVARDSTWRLSLGLGHTGTTMLRLLLGPTVVALVLIVTTLISERWLLSLGFPPDGTVFLAYFTLVRTFGFLTTIFAVAVLCQSYRELRPQAAIPTHTGTLTD